ncbi:MAG: hypothetical protein G01um101416_482 [Microgenomates group bacterium Gr01-1014_16]|nr:MAG: hypothetical protein G01um101416_482 [Microgenomates group bacterium Gr01-1014_16]
MTIVMNTTKKLAISDFGKPVVDIVPQEGKKTEVDPLLALKGKLLKYEDPFEPVGLEDWEALK